MWLIVIFFCLNAIQGTEENLPIVRLQLPLTNDQNSYANVFPSKTKSIRRINNWRHGNPCIPNPCLNSGKCLLLSDNESVCLCPETHRGSLCQIARYNSLFECQCKNHEVCYHDLTNDDYYCDCNQKYAGYSCDKSTYPCLSSSYCNLTTSRGCSLHGLTIACKCDQPYSGDQCDKEIRSPVSDCKMECIMGECLDDGHCKCHNGYTGIHCNIQIDPCKENSCGNFLCIRGELDLYYCQHPNGSIVQPEQLHSFPNPCLNKTAGQIVSILWDKTLFAICTINQQAFLRSCPKHQIFDGIRACHQINESSICLHGGIARFLSQSMFECVCQAGFDGPYCEHITDPCLNVSCGSFGFCQRLSARSFVCICDNGNLITDSVCEHDSKATLNKLATSHCMFNSSLMQTGIFNQMNVYVQCTYDGEKSPMFYYSQCPWGYLPVPNSNVVRKSNTTVCYNSTYPIKEMHPLMHPLLRFVQFRHIKQSSKILESVKHFVSPFPVNLQFESEFDIVFVNLTSIKVIPNNRDPKMTTKVNTLFNILLQKK